MDPITIYLTVVGFGMLWCLVELYNEYYPPHRAYWKARR